jgi:acetolactate synthase-1/2/3 large subunit
MQSRLNGAEALIKSLESQGVEYIFGYSGGAVIPIFDALVTIHTSIKLITTRHEQGATHMADGYARASGKPGVVLVTSGPGAGNAITGLMTARMDNVPLIVISGQQITSMLGFDAFQEADVFNLSMPVVKHNYLIFETNDIPRIVREAFHIATSDRPGPVLIDIPKDISSGVFSGSLLDTAPPTKARTIVDSRLVDKTTDLLIRAKRPVILAGHGVLIAKAEHLLQTIATQFDIPVVTTLLGKGAIDETNALSLGMLGMHGTAYANKAVEEADAIINIGSRFDDRIVGDVQSFTKHATIVHVDIDEAELGKMIVPDIRIHADANDFLQALLLTKQHASHTDWRHHLESYKQQFPLAYDDSDGLTQQHVIDTVWRLSKGQFAQPTQQVITIVGDGGFQMTLYELATAAIHKLPIKIFVMNNHYLGMVRQWQELFYDNRLSGVDMEGNPDFVKLAQSYGIKALNIEYVGEVEAKVAEALAYNEGPILINCEVVKTENVYPMIPAGRGYETMLISAPTTKLEKPIGST